MKRLFILLLIPCLSQGQVYKYRCFEYKLFYDDSLSEKGWQKSNILVVLNQQKLKINTYGKSEQDVDLVKLDSVCPDKQGVRLEYQGVNEEGTKCAVIVYAQKLGFENVNGLILSFPTYAVTMMLRKND